MNEWQYVFAIGALVYIVPGITFLLFGSGEVQEWNEKKEKVDAEQSQWMK